MSEVAVYDQILERRAKELSTPIFVRNIWSTEMVIWKSDFTNDCVNST